MSRAMTNFWLDFLLLTLFLVLGWATAVLAFLFPGAEESVGWTLWGWSYSAWCRFQQAFVLLLAVGVLVHLMLHWNWVCEMVPHVLRRRDGRRGRRGEATRTLWGVGTLIVVLHLVGLALAAAAFSVRSGTGGP